MPFPRRPAAPATPTRAAAPRPFPEDRPSRSPGSLAPTSTARPVDPANEAHFTVRYKNEFIGWFREVSGLSAEVEMLPWPEGGQNGYEWKLPGRLKYPNLVLKSGVTASAELTKWLFESQDYGAKPADVTVQLRDRRGAPVRTWVFQGARVAKWTGPNLNVASNNPAVETIEIVHQGLQRPTSG